MKIVSKEECLSHYFWKSNTKEEQCSAWNLVDELSLSVKLESIPPGNAENLHFHHHAQQFFFVLKGQATIYTQLEEYILNTQQGLLISAGEKHRIVNHGTEALEFLLISQPSTANDRVNC